jgi:hypothetical protein
VLLVGDFRQGAPEVLSMRASGARVFVAGMASAAVRKQMEAAGVAISGLVRSRKAVLEAALERMGGCDAVLVATPGWQEELEALRRAELEAAVTDGRRMIPILARDDKETARKSAKQHSGGHTKQNPEPRARRSRRA